MQKKNEVFFGKHGITSTSANHLANIAKELIADNEAKLKNITFVTTTIDIVGTATPGKAISRGYTEGQLGEVRRLIEEIAAMHAFCAWVREAVKAKEEELELVAGKEYDQWEQEAGLEPLESTSRRRRYIPVDEDDIISEMNIRERNEYYRLEAYAAAIGKYIHGEGALATAREALHTAVMKPYSTEGTGTETLIYQHTPSIDQQKVEELFFDLQKWHRANEAQLNRIKYNIRQQVAQRNMEKSQQYRSEMEEYDIQFRKLNAQFKEWKIKECQRISQLKIVIPLELQPTYDALCELEK